jgi:hypothetical protein
MSSWRCKRKRRKGAPSDESMVHKKKRQCSWYIAQKAKMKMSSSDDPTIQFLDAPDELQRRSSRASSTGWSDGLSEDTVGLSDASFESRQRRAKTRASAPDDRRWSNGSSDGHEETKRDALATSPSAPDDLTHHRCIASEQLCQQIFNG